MIPKEPNLPIVRPNDPKYLDDLNYTLTLRLRDMAEAINQFSGSKWNGPHPVLGTTHIWVDATGKLRIKASAPSTDLDGVVVGTQT